MNSVRLSVVVPVYRHDKILELTLDSIKKSYLPSLMEVIVVNNYPGREYAKTLLEDSKYPFTYYENEESLPLVDNWNKCVSLASGEWVQLLHEDDIVYEDFYKRFFAALSSSKDMGVFFCQYFNISENNKILGVSKLLVPESGILSSAAEAQISANIIQPPTIIIKKEVYERHGFFRSDLKYVVDWEMWYRACLNSVVWYESEPLAGYRLHGNQETHAIVLSGDSARDLIYAVGKISQYCPAAHKKLAELYAKRHILAFAKKLAIDRKANAAYLQLRILLLWKPRMVFDITVLQIISWLLKQYTRRKILTVYRRFS